MAWKLSEPCESEPNPCAAGKAVEAQPWRAFRRCKDTNKSPHCTKSSKKNSNSSIPPLVINALFFTQHLPYPTPINPYPTLLPQKIHPHRTPPQQRFVSQIVECHPPTTTLHSPLSTLHSSLSTLQRVAPPWGLTDLPKMSKFSQGFSPCCCCFVEFLESFRKFSRIFDVIVSQLSLSSSLSLFLHCGIKLENLNEV